MSEIDDETFEEWRVTGEPGGGYPTYRFTWTSDMDGHGLVCSDPESAARSFVEAARDWDDGPHLHHRTVTRTTWTPTHPAPTSTGAGTTGDAQGDDR